MSKRFSSKRIKYYSIESRCVTAPENIYGLQGTSVHLSARTFFTGWGSEGVKLGVSGVNCASSARYMLELDDFADRTDGRTDQESPD